MNDFLNRRKSGGDTPDPKLEQSVRSALEEQADQFEPRSDAFVRLQHRVAAASSQSSSPWALNPRVMAMAAAVLVLVGITGFLSQRQDGVGVVADSADQIDLEVPVTTTVSLESKVTTSFVAEDLNTEYAVAGGLIAAPLAESPVDAAVAFLTLIRMEDQFTELRQEGPTVLVYGQSDDRNQTDLLTTLDIESVESEDGSFSYVVARASSGSANLNRFDATRVSTNSIEASGSFAGWETGSASLRLYSSNDGVLLNAQVLETDPSAPGEFAQEVPVSGIDHGWVVIAGTASDEAGAAEFLAEPVFFLADLSATQYQVVHIPVDDPLGGLQVRHTPDPDGEVLPDLDPLPAGYAGIYRRGQVPNKGTDGKFDWWSVELESGERGWVNARYLAAADPVDDDELRTVAMAFHQFVTDPDSISITSIWPDEDLKPVQVGWTQGLRNVTAQELTSQEFWNDASQVWEFPEASGEPSVESSLRDFVSLPVDIELDTDSDTQFSSPYELDLLAEASNFGSLARVTISPAAASTDTAQRSTTLFVENTVDGPKIVGIAIWIWTP